MLKHFEERNVACTSTALYRATGVYINGDNEVDILHSVKSCLLIALEMAQGNDDGIYLCSQRSGLGGLYSKTGKAPPVRDLGLSELLHFRRVVMRMIASNSNHIAKHEWAGLAAEVVAAVV
jgi:hypothetical protein